MALGKCFPYKCKHIAFYYTGAGGCDERGNPFIQVEDGKKGRFYISTNMLAHFAKHKINKRRRCLFFFECSFTSDHIHELETVCFPHVPSRCLVAFAASSGLKSPEVVPVILEIGLPRLEEDSYEGGRWTSSLCKNLKQQLSLSDILDLTNADVEDTCLSTFINSAGPVFLKGQFMYAIFVVSTRSFNTNKCC